MPSPRKPINEASSEAMTNIDGPRPINDKKCPNSANQFWENHQAEYEARGGHSNRMEWVQRHNTAYPKLWDELEKRRRDAQCHAEQLSVGGYAGSQGHCSQKNGNSWHTNSLDTLNSPSSIASLSSYNSYGSMNQEPMVHRR